MLLITSSPTKLKDRDVYSKHQVWRKPAYKKRNCNPPSVISLGSVLSMDTSRKICYTCHQIMATDEKQEK